MLLPTRNRFLFLTFWLAIFAAVPVHAKQVCTPDFPDRNGWLGGDAAYSIELDSTRTVWLFGDSFVSEAGKTSRRDSQMVRNAIAISNCDVARRWSVDYFWGARQKAKSETAIFVPKHSRYDYWPLDGFMHRGRLYIVLSHVISTPGVDLGFKQDGVDIAVVENPLDHPDQWKIAYRRWMQGNGLLPGASIVIEAGFAYVFTLDQRENSNVRRMILLRLPLAKLHAPGKHTQYLDSKNHWRSGLDIGKAKTVMAMGHSEMSVRQHPGDKSWVGISGGSFHSPDIYLQKSARLEGPWSVPQAVFRFPEMDASSPSFRADFFCYAVKQQSQFERERKFLVTYACNSKDFMKLVDTPNIYRPRSVWLPLPD